jgi:hypothetical protein
VVESPSREKEEDLRRGSVLPDLLILARAAVGSLHSNSRLTCTECTGTTVDGNLCYARTENWMEMWLH